MSAADEVLAAARGLLAEWRMGDCPDPDCAHPACRLLRAVAKVDADPFPQLEYAPGPYRSGEDARVNPSNGVFDVRGRRIGTGYVTADGGSGASVSQARLFAASWSMHRALSSALDLLRAVPGPKAAAAFSLLDDTLTRVERPDVVRR